MKALYNGMLSPVLVRRLEDLWPGSLHVVTEIEQFSTSNERYLEV